MVNTDIILHNLGYADSIKCGGIILASDIDAHKEGYKDGSMYFNPYSAVD
ncbi:MAG: hypothetical protein ACI8XX_000187 [Polaribacter sp.]|jgi:hypothetical protein